MKMNKKLLAGVSAAALTLSVPAALAETADSALVQGGSLNLRAAPSLTAKVLGQFPTGTLVEIVSEGSEWYQVEVNGLEGYMMARFLKTDVSAQAATVRTNGSGLNLREEPDMEGAILTSVENGGSVIVLQKGTEWSRVSADGEEGFMATRYLRFDAEGAPVTGMTAVVSNPRDTQVLNLRKEASLNAKVIDYYRNGVEVTILKAGTTWHKVQVEDGKVGYMMARFLKLTGETGQMQPFQAETVNVNGGAYVNLRKGASLSAKVLDRVDVGASVTVIEHGTDWCKVIADGQEGYMSTWFLKW